MTVFMYMMLDLEEPSLIQRYEHVSNYQGKHAKGYGLSLKSILLRSMFVVLIKRRSTGCFQ